MYVYLLLAVVYVCLARAQIHVNAKLVRNIDADSASSKAAHPFARCLLIGIMLALGESALEMLHCTRYVFNGIGLPGVDILAQVLATSSTFVLACLLLLISQGKCVSYNMVAGDTSIVLKLLGPFFLCCFVLELWGEHSVAQNYTTDYVYTKPCGAALILADIFLLCLYATNLRQTYLAEKDRDEGRFYRSWGLLYASWFLTLPITAVLAQTVLAPYVWYMVCIAVKRGVTALVYATLVIGLWPGNTRTYFNLKRALRRAAQRRTSLPGLLGRAVVGMTDQDCSPCGSPRCGLGGIKFPQTP